MGNASESSHSSSPETCYHVAQPRMGSAGAIASGLASRADRPCDSCRRRKSRCSREPGQPRCVLCTFHLRECTYLDEPQRRKRRRTEVEASCLTDGQAIGEDHKKPITLPAPTRDDQTRILTNGGSESKRSLLDRTLGLHRTTHSKYIGPSSLHDPYLLDLLPRGSRPADGNDDDVHHDNGASNKFRRVDPSTIFIIRQDSETLFSSDDDDDLEAIEQIVRPHGPALVNLYFRIVHPSYPILHKGVFLEKYGRTYREFAAPLLAAVYVLAMDWWDYDRELCSLQNPPDAERLIKAATKTLTSVVHRPKLSTLQAGLLLLQRSGGDSWVLTSQIVAVAEELGLHVDCSTWNIPEWEKGLRRRIAWAIYMQDKWGALIHGRPSHITRESWQAPRCRPLRLEDFPESAADEDEEEGSTEVEKGRQLFMHLAVLTEIVADALELLYPLDDAHSRTGHALPCRGMPGVLELVKPIAMRLREWAAGVPPGLRMEDVKTRKLCSNGYLHLSYFAAEIVIHKIIVRTLALHPRRPASSAETNKNQPIFSATTPQLRNMCRAAARARFDHAITFVESLRPEHLEGFWWFASSKCLALIGIYGALLWATSDSTSEAEGCRRRLDDFRWGLKVRAKSSTFLAQAICEMDEALGGLDMSQPPPPPPSSLQQTATLASSSAFVCDAESRTSSLTPVAGDDEVPAYQGDSFTSLQDSATFPALEGLDYDASLSPGLFAASDGLHIELSGLHNT